MKSILLSPGRDPDERLRVALVGRSGADLFDRRDVLLARMSRPVGLRSYVLPDCADDILADVPDLILADRRGAAAIVDDWIARSQNAYGTRAPIVVFDASPSADDILRAMRAGASDFVDTDDSEESIGAAIERAIALRAGAVERRVAEAQVAVADAERRFARIVEARVHARIARQLRQPLAATLAYAREASEGLADPELASRRLELVLRNSERSLAVVEGVLDYLQLHEDEPRVGTSAPDTELATVDLHDFAARIRDAHCAAARARGLDFVVAVSTPSSGESVHIAAEGLARVLGYLVDNAIRFTERGRVQIDLHVGPDADLVMGTPAVLVCRVSDSGIGMDPETLAWACEPFGASARDGDRHFEGAGLGIATSLRLLGLIGGDLAIDSTPGLGTVCTVRVPTHRAQFVES